MIERTADKTRGVGPNKKRRWWLAAFLSLLCPGLGQLYTTKAKRGLICFGVVAGLIAIRMSLFYLPPNQFLPVILVVVVSGLTLLASLIIIVDAAIGARRIGEVPLKNYNKLYVYLGAVLASMVVILIWDPRPFVATAWETYSIPAASMNPTIMKGSYVVSWNEYYATHEPKRGEIAIFKLPADGETDYIMRIVGLPGDRIQMKDGFLHINGSPVPREPVLFRHGPVPYRIPDDVTEYGEFLPGGASYLIWEEGDDHAYDNTPEYEVPPGHYFVLGDNRDNSLDSRVMHAVGFIPRENLHDLATFIFWFSDWRLFGTKAQPLP